jgi:hypothetical protein
VDAPALRIIGVDLAERCDRRRLHMRTRYLKSLAKGGRVPERAHGKYLLTGGMLVCPTCGGHFERLKEPWREAVYVCATRRRKPGICTNRLTLPVEVTDDTILSTIEGEVLGTRTINDLLMLVDQGAVNDTARLTADRDRLRTEVDRLVGSIAAGVPAETVAPQIRSREAEIVKLEAKLRVPRQAPPDIERLRTALTLRAEQWKRDLRAEPKVARLLLRRLVGPLVLWDEPRPDWVKWEAAAKPEALLEGQIQLVASPDGADDLYVVAGTALRAA